MRALTTAIAFSACAMSFGQSHFRFIVTGDDRWETKGARAGMDENGVNVAAMKTLVKAMLAEKPALLLFNGDLVGGATIDEAEASQLQTFMGTMKPMYDAGVKVLVVRGNHEMHCPHSADVWRKTFSGPYANPAGGPAGEEGLTFALPYGNALFVGLDQFQNDKPTVNQAWLDTALAKNHATHVFAFAHKMAFKDGHHIDGMNTAPEARDRFLTSLADAGARVVFFGHDHMYDHLVALKDGWPESRSIHQFVVGTAGAPFVSGTSTEASDGPWKLTHLAHVEKKLGYCVVDVDGQKVSITFKAESKPGIFEAADTFSYEIAK